MLSAACAVYLLGLGAPLPAPAPRKAEPPAVRLLRASSEEGPGWATFEATNPNPTPLPFFGCRVEPEGKAGAGRFRAHYDVKASRGGTWERFTPKRCKLRVDPVSIPPRGRVTFDVYVPAGRWDEVRIGFPWFPSAGRDEPATAWSSAVKREDLAPKSP